MTLADFAALPDGPGKRELLKGELISVPPPKMRHGMIQQRLVEIFGGYLRNSGGYRVFTNVGFSMPDETCLEPDVAIVRDEQVARTAPDEWFSGTPALAVEILSPSNTAAEIEDKVRAYLDGGADAVWVINPRRGRLTAFDRSGRFESVEMPGGEIAIDALLPGLRVSVRELFAGLE